MSMPQRSGALAHFLLPTLLLSIPACAPGLVAQTGTSGCRPADPVRSPARLTFLKELVSSSDSDYVTSRQDLGLPIMRTSKVTLVTRQRDCEKAVEALNSVRQEPGRSGRYGCKRLGARATLSMIPVWTSGMRKKSSTSLARTLPIRGPIPGSSLGGRCAPDTVHWKYRLHHRDLG